MRAAIPLVLAMALTGCATGSNGGESVSIYRLEADPTAVATAAATRDAVIQVVLPEAAAGYDTRGIAYRERPHEVNYYTRSRWADTPARMLEGALVAALERSNTFRAVLRGPSAVNADYRLASELLRLEQIFQPGKPSEVLLRVRVQLIGSDQRRLIATRVIEARAPSPTEDAAGAVAAAHAALEQVLAQVVEFAAKAVPAEQKAR